MSRYVGAAALSPGREDELSEGEAALMQGDADKALQAFEQAGALGHDPVIELGLVRAAMQGGRYRQAQGFASHTAGEHVHDSACMAIHAWLLHLGGQTPYATQVIEQARAVLSAPGQALLNEVARQWLQGWPFASNALRRAPLRLAPYAHGEPIAAHAQAVCSGTLVMGADHVQRVILPANVVDIGASRWWVRNGLGLTVCATLEDAEHGQAVRTLRLVSASLPGQAVLAERDAFPGSIAYAVSYANGPQDTQAATPSESARATASWPLMRMGFAGRVDAAFGRLLGVEGPDGPWSQSDGTRNALGGPVWNAKGQLIGVALPSIDGKSPDRMWPASALRRPGWVAQTQVNNALMPMPLDEIYELSLKTCVQVIAATHDEAHAVLGGGSGTLDLTNM